MERTAYPRLILLLGLLPVFAALLVYSVTWSFVWDEGFHLIAAQLIAAGQRPYLDFCFPQTPLNAYLNAAILLVFGERWQPVHVMAALYICGVVWLVADFVQSRLPAVTWRTPCALAAAVLFGLNTVVTQFGPCGQAYAIAMLFGMSAFRAALAAVRSRRPWLALLTGVFAGAAAASTLLIAPLPMVLFGWFLLRQPYGSRFSKSAAFIAGCALPFAPVIWLFALGPKQTLFNILQYQTIFRRTNWGDANLHDIDALSSWIASPATLLLIALFAAALGFLWRTRASGVGREFLLAVALSVALVLFISTAHPTFERYFCVAVPFVAIVAALGLYAAASRLATPNHAWLSCGIVIFLCWAIFARGIFDERDDEHWSDYEEVAQQVAGVTPINANLYADELVYFILRRTPPEGMAFSYAQKLDLPAAQEKLFHIISLKTLKKQVQSGQFATLQTCRDSIIDSYEPEKYFKHHEEPSDCDVFWQPNSKR